MCVIPFEAGVLEFGRADDVVEWEKASSPPLLPKGEMRQGFENPGASYAMFWAKDGDKFHVIADYVTESRKEALKPARGDDETFCSRSREVNIDANGDGPIATALKTGKEVSLMGLIQDEACCARRGVWPILIPFCSHPEWLARVRYPQNCLFCPAMSSVHPSRCAATRLVQVKLCTGKKPKARWLLRVSIQLLPAKRRLQIWASLAALAMHRKSMCPMPMVMGQLEQ